MCQPQGNLGAHSLMPKVAIFQHAQAGISESTHPACAICHRFPIRFFSAHHGALTGVEGDPGQHVCSQRGGKAQEAPQEARQPAGFHGCVSAGGVQRYG